jgi:hypothetical protein
MNPYGCGFERGTLRAERVWRPLLCSGGAFSCARAPACRLRRQLAARPSMHHNSRRWRNLRGERGVPRVATATKAAIAGLMLSAHGMPPRPTVSLWSSWPGVQPHSPTPGGETTPQLEVDRTGFSAARCREGLAGGGTPVPRRTESPAKWRRGFQQPADGGCRSERHGLRDASRLREMVALVSASLSPL